MAWKLCKKIAIHQKIGNIKFLPSHNCMVWRDNDHFPLMWYRAEIGQSIHLDVTGDKCVSSFDSLLLHQISIVFRRVDAHLPNGAIYIHFHNIPPKLKRKESIVYIDSQHILVPKISLIVIRMRHLLIRIIKENHRIIFTEFKVRLLLFIKSVKNPIPIHCSQICIAFAVGVNFVFQRALHIRRNNNIGIKSFTVKHFFKHRFTWKRGAVNDNECNWYLFSLIALFDGLNFGWKKILKLCCLTTPLTPFYFFSNAIFGLSPNSTDKIKVLCCQSKETP